MTEPWWTEPDLEKLASTQAEMLIKRGWPEAEAISISARFWQHVDRTGDCWIWRLKSKGGQMGYGVFCVKSSTAMSGKQQYAHRAAYTLVYGDIRYGMLVRHSCDNVRCVRPEHLIEGTYQENTQDMLRRGRSRMQRQPEHARKILEGVRARNIDKKKCGTRLTEQQRLEIGRLRSEGWTLTALAGRFQVSKVTIGRWSREYKGGDAE